MPLAVPGHSTEVVRSAVPKLGSVILKRSPYEPSFPCEDFS